MNSKWVQEAKYLGIYIVNAQKFKCNFDQKKRNITELPMRFLLNLAKPCVYI